MTARKLLIVEDDSALLRGLKDNFRAQGYAVRTAADGQRGLEALLSDPPDLVVLDLMLPKVNGYEICRRARSQRLHTAIIMLSAKNQVEDVVRGLEVGADDYVTKPFSARELRARIRARLRSRQPETEEILRCGEIEIDTARAEISRRGEKTEVTAQEFKLLLVFARNRGRVLSRDQLIDLAWGRDTSLTDRAVDAHIVNLRRKLGHELIASVRGMGYRFDG